MITSTIPFTTQGPAVLQDHPDTATQAEHLVPLTDEWKMWCWVGLRGAGFPLRHVLTLSASECADSAGRVLALEETVIKACQKALVALQQLAQDSTKNTQKIRNAIRRLKEGKQQEITPELTAVSSELSGLMAAEKELASARDDYNKTYDAAWEEASATIYQIAELPEFREALIWQNRALLHGSVASLVRANRTKSLGELRRQQELVARYLQRYCTKNDTIGFFGPVGWAAFNANTGAAATVKCGPRLLKQRKTYFEAWCIDQLAASFSRCDALLPWAIVRRLPFVYSEITGAKPDQALAQLAEAEKKVLDALDSPVPAVDLVDDVLRRPSLGLTGREQVFGILEKLRELGLITWEFGGPLETVPEQRLHRQLAAISDQNLRQQAIHSLDALQAIRWRIENSAGNTEELDRAFSELEEKFTQLTKASSMRSQGRTYAGRSLVYEDCVRDVSVEFGRPFLQALAPPLELLLASARWFTHDMAKEYRKAFAEIYYKLAQETGSGSVNAALFYFKAQALFFGGKVRIPQEVQKRVTQGWKQILCAPADSRRANYTTKELRPKVEKVFDAPGPGWNLARYHSPDLMISAGSLEAMLDGDYEIILGELHIAGNTLGSSFFVHQHPSPKNLLLAYEHDLPEARVVPVSSKNWPGSTARTNPVLVSSKDFWLETGRDPSCGSPAQTLAIGEMWIEEINGQLVVRSKNRSRRFDIVEFFSGLLTGAAIAHFNLTSNAPHSARITIDKLIVCRESWLLSPHEIDFAHYTDSADQFLGAQDLRRLHGMPRFVFVKAPPEVKPFYVDFESPIFVGMFAKFVRRTEEADPSARITVSEMLPAPHQTWLPDAHGERFTCELRMVAVDGRVQ